MRRYLSFFAFCSCVLAPALASAADDEYTPKRPPHRGEVELAHGSVLPSSQWDSQGAYFIMGLAPASTLYIDGFNPSLRYDWEIGMHWTRRRTAVFVGAEARVQQVFGRKAPGGGVDGVLTVSQGPVYGRVGAGVVTGIPSTRDPYDAPPAMGGLVGLGLQGRAGALVGRIGIDYDARIDTQGRMNQTVLLTLRFVFGF